MTKQRATIIGRADESYPACHRSVESGCDVGGLRSRRWSVLVFLVTIWLVLRGPAPGQTRVGPTLGLLRYYFPGYEVSVLGSFIGFFYGALAGALIGWVIAVVYNSVAGYRLGDHRDAPST